MNLLCFGIIMNIKTFILLLNFKHFFMLPACQRDSQTCVWFCKSGENKLHSRLHFVFALTLREIRCLSVYWASIAGQILMSVNSKSCPDASIVPIRDSEVIIWNFVILAFVYSVTVGKALETQRTGYCAAPGLNARGALRGIELSS